MAEFWLTHLAEFTPQLQNFPDDTKVELYLRAFEIAHKPEGVEETNLLHLRLKKFLEPGDTLTGFGMKNDDVVVAIPSELPLVVGLTFAKNNRIPEVHRVRPKNGRRWIKRILVQHAIGFLFGVLTIVVGGFLVWYFGFK